MNNDWQVKEKRVSKWWRLLSAFVMLMIWSFVVVAISPIHGISPAVFAWIKVIIVVGGGWWAIPSICAAIADRRKEKRITKEWEEWQRMR